MLQNQPYLLFDGLPVRVGLPKRLNLLNENGHLLTLLWPIAFLDCPCQKEHGVSAWVSDRDLTGGIQEIGMPKPALNIPVLQPTAISSSQWIKAPVSPTENEMLFYLQRQFDG